MERKRGEKRLGRGALSRGVAWLAVIGFHVSSLPGSGQKSKELMEEDAAGAAASVLARTRNGRGGKRKMRRRRPGAEEGDATPKNERGEEGGGHKGGEEKEREKERERGGNEKERRSARTILINPVPGSRSRSNRVHDLQGIYIRSSTRGYNSIPSFYSALSAGLKP